MASKHTFQAPRGTRDFYPEDMAIRRYIESVWREVSINHGFEEIEGPMFEHLDLYKTKSGEGIVSELFSFTRAGGKTEYALRPEFTPTLARMYAARAKKLSKPTKWFVIPNHFRAERPQRGRLREFMQWNADYVGIPEVGTFVADADIEIISVTIGIMKKFGFTPKQIRIKLGHRKSVEDRLLRLGVPDVHIESSLLLLDARQKLETSKYVNEAKLLEWSKDAIDWFHPENRTIIRLDDDLDSLDLPKSEIDSMKHKRQERGDLQGELIRAGFGEWCEFDSMIIRGLAYYTGTVFEVHEASGKERAIAGGGRYDHLIELCGGPPTPAVGIAMGDVVLRLVLDDHDLLGPDRVSVPHPDVFVISLGVEDSDIKLKKIVSDLRSENHHIRHTYKATRKLKKLLGEAEGLGSRLVIILDEKLAEGEVTIKDMKQGSQEQVRLNDLRREISERLNRA
ncbi:MAG: histidine--tRNA ligase [Planctomycetes bacterium]|nr:histidine--tRNA ligase [Planctomycetota bacterium]